MILAWYGLLIYGGLLHRADHGAPGDCRDGGRNSAPGTGELAELEGRGITTGLASQEPAELPPDRMAEFDAVAAGTVDRWG